MKASIIIPIYNAEKSIQTALDSLVVQSEPDFEVLMIDDCSTDNTAEICKKYNEKDRRFKPVSLSVNMGASAARNIGINKATGDYLMFMDSDDTVQVDFVKKLIDTSLQNNADITWCNFQYRQGNSVIKTDQGMRNTIDYKKYIECYTENTTGAGCLWNKAYRREFIDRNSLRIDENRVYGEDWDFNFRVALCIPRVVAISDTLYDYVQNTTSISRRYFPSDYDNYCKSYKMMVEAIERYELSTSHSDLNCRFVYDIVSLLQKLAYSTISRKKKKQEFERISKSEHFNSVLVTTPWHNNALTFKQNIIAAVLRLKLYNLTWLMLQI